MGVRGVLLGIAAAALAAGSAQAADVAGVWMTPTKGEVEIYHCGPAICGKLLSSTELKKDATLKDTRNKDESKRGRGLKGLTFITGFKGGPPEWKDGQLYNPEDGNTYAGSITLGADGKLKLKGCAMAVLCKTQTWTRIR